MKRILFIIFALFVMVGTAAAGDPMRTKIRTRLPENVSTIGKAAQYYADVINYRLTTGPPAPADCAGIAGLSINPLFDQAAVLPIEEAILALLDPEIFLVIDTKHKLFSFQQGGTNK